jgi:hypothetical protein
LECAQIDIALKPVLYGYFRVDRAPHAVFDGVAYGAGKSDTPTLFWRDTDGKLSWGRGRGVIATEWDSAMTI